MERLLTFACRNTSDEMESAECLCLLLPVVAEDCSSRRVLPAVVLRNTHTRLGPRQRSDTIRSSNPTPYTRRSWSSRAETPPCRASQDEAAVRRAPARARCARGRLNAPSASPRPARQPRAARYMRLRHPSPSCIMRRWNAMTFGRTYSGGVFRWLIQARCRILEFRGYSAKPETVVKYPYQFLKSFLTLKSESPETLQLQSLDSDHSMFLVEFPAPPCDDDVEMVGRSRWVTGQAWREEPESGKMEVWKESMLGRCRQHRPLIQRTYQHRFPQPAVIQVPTVLPRLYDSFLATLALGLSCPILLLPEGPPPSDHCRMLTTALEPRRRRSAQAAAPQGRLSGVACTQGWERSVRLRMHEEMRGSIQRTQLLCAELRNNAEGAQGEPPHVFPARFPVGWARSTPRRCRGDVLAGAGPPVRGHGDNVKMRGEVSRLLPQLRKPLSTSFGEPSCGEARDMTSSRMHWMPAHAREALYASSIGAPSRGEAYARPWRRSSDTLGVIYRGSASRAYGPCLFRRVYSLWCMHELPSCTGSAVRETFGTWCMFLTEDVAQTCGCVGFPSPLAPACRATWREDARANVRRLRLVLINSVWVSFNSAVPLGL
ncbi:hypothetical protein C8R44DRAFT_958078 [Mycena epipterygia]|nr:hypothetical protein C8R44DRAFT_958078 [Mycena epipterygia]